MGAQLKVVICRILNARRRQALRRDWAPVLRLDRSKVEQRQVELLRDLLVHAGRHVPYYRDLFRGLSFDPVDFKGLEQLRVLPVLTKEIVRGEGVRLLAGNFSRGRLMEKTTGGSTGEPLVFYRHREYLADAMMGNFRNFSLCGWSPGEPVAYFWGVNDPASFRRRALKEEVNLGFYTFDAFNAGPAGFEKWLGRIRKIRPAVWYGYASSIWLFCKWLASTGAVSEQFPRPAGVFTTAEKLHDFQRESIADTLGVPVYNLYGSTEIQNVAFECGKGNMHVASDFAVVETTDADAGGVSPLLLTSLRNYAMPFIRYRNEDTGSLSGARCGCGINTPCMSVDIGRECDNFRTRSGRLIHGEMFTHMMEGIRGVATFQFMQTEPDKVVLRVVRDQAAVEDPGTQVARVPGAIQARTDGEIGVDVEWVASIPLTPFGKHIFTISRWSPHPSPLPGGEGGDGASSPPLGGED